MISPIQQFREAMRVAGIAPPDLIEADGVLRRFSTNGKSDDAAGWYVLHSGFLWAGAFGDWRLGVDSKWRANIGRILTPAEEDDYRVKWESTKLQRQAEKNRRREEAREQANLKWAEAVRCFKHPYLTKKGIGANGSRIYKDTLVIPIRDGDMLYSLQFIDLNGEKKFLPGGRVAGCYSTIGNLTGSDTLCIVEGFATGASVHEASGLPVVVGFNAGNLKAVAIAMLEKYPHLHVVLCADDDHATPGNPGLTKATEAAMAVNGQVAVPEFGPDRPNWSTDFNDMAQLGGKEAVRQAISTTVAKARNAPRSRTKESTCEYQETVELICASKVKLAPISWLWEGYLSEGKLHILGGAAGTGKTTISMDLAAIVTTGGHWPDRTKSPMGNVVIWSGEDDPSDTLVPRLVQAGADLAKVHFVTGVRDGDEKRPFDPARDMHQLLRALADIGGASLLIIDPIVSAIVGDSHKNAEVRRGLQPLGDLASSANCAVLGITHFSKGTAGRDPVERITGSLAFGAVARVVMVAAKNQEENEEGRSTRLFLRVKSNIGPDDGGFEYELQHAELKTTPGIHASAVVWGHRVEGPARDLLATADSTNETGKGSALTHAEAFLFGLLAKGSVYQTEIETLALKAGYSTSTIQRAKKSLNIISVKEGGNFGGPSPKWSWMLPTAEDAQGDQIDQGHQDRQSEEIGKDVQQKKMITFRTFDHLQGDEDMVEVEI